MSNLYCKCCNFQAIRPAEFKRHLQTKKHNKRIQQNNTDTNSYHYVTNSYHSDTINYPSESETSKKIKCKYCNKEFAFNSGLSRHIKYHCKKNKDEDLKELVRLLNKEMEIMKEDYKSLSTNNKQLVTTNNNLTKQITKLSKKLQIQNIGQQNILNGNLNNTINNNQNINILNHKDTNYGFLTDKDYINCIKTCNHCVKNLIEKVHFNKNHPENMNIYISSMKTDYLMVYRDNNWNIVDRSYHLDSLYSDNEMQLENWYDEYKDKYPHIIQKFERYLHNREHNEVIDRVKKDILRLLYNKRKLVTQNFKPQSDSPMTELNNNEQLDTLTNIVC